MDRFSHARHRRSLKLVIQSESAECGLACLTMIGNYFGHDYDIGYLRSRFPGIGSRGLTLQNMMNIANDLQLQPSAFKLDLDGIDSLSLPCVLHWDLNHFVVLSSIKSGKFEIFDPAGLVRNYTPREFSKHFTGVALELHPVEGFVAEAGKASLSLRSFAGRVRGLGKAWATIGFVSFGLLMLSLIMPYYSILVMDEGIATRDRSFLISALIAALVVVTLQIGLTYFRNRAIIYLGAQFAYQSHSNLIVHLLRLPLKFYSTRHAGDILARVHSLDDVKKTLTETLLTSIIDGIITIASFLLLLLYSWELTLVVVAIVAIATVVEVFCHRPTMDALSAVLEAESKEQSSLLESVRGMQSIKLYGIESDRLNSWAKHFSKKLNAELFGRRVALNAEIAKELLFGVEKVATLYIGANLVVDTSISLGVLLAFVAKKEEFLVKYVSLLKNVLSFNLLDVHLKRLSDLVLQDQEVTHVSREVSIVGGLELRDINYRYSPNEPFLFQNLNLKVHPGESIAIAGPSGSGKTTLVKIMLGLIESHSGEVLVDGMSINRVRETYRRHVATVMQDDCILSGSIIENITFFDSNLDMNWAQECAMKACIHEDIMKMAMGYHSLVSDYNNTISGGQKQRILIARALYRRPKILFMDEATSALDIENEKVVNRAISDLGVTRIIIAHRAETIASADKIYRLENGRIYLDSADDGKVVA